MSDLLDTLTKLGEAATKGPWTLSDHDNEIWSPEILHVIVKAYNHGRAAGIDKHEDAAYIVALANAAPTLIALAKLAEEAHGLFAVGDRDAKAYLVAVKKWFDDYAAAQEKKP
jgi:hypothetical protein